MKYRDVLHAVVIPESERVVLISAGASPACRLGTDCARVIEAQEQEKEYPQCVVKSSGDSDPPHLEIHASFGSGISPFNTHHVQMGSEFFPEAGFSQQRRIGLATISDLTF